MKKIEEKKLVMLKSFMKREQALTTSLIVAETFEKEHKNVLRDIEEIVGKLTAETAPAMFQKSFYKVEGQTRKYPMYYLNFDGFLLLAMGLSGKKALEFKLAYIKNKPTSFEELIELEFNSPPATKTYVYVLEMDNRSVKIGRTTDLYRRFNQITNASGLTIFESCHTVPLEHSDACRIETLLKRNFEKHKINGEFFDVPFDVVKQCLENYAELSNL